MKWGNFCQKKCVYALLSTWKLISMLIKAKSACQSCVNPSIRITVERAWKNYLTKIISFLSYFFPLSSYINVYRRCKPRMTVNQQLVCPSIFSIHTCVKLIRTTTFDSNELVSSQTMFLLWSKLCWVSIYQCSAAPTFFATGSRVDLVRRNVLSGQFPLRGNHQRPPSYRAYQRCRIRHDPAFQAYT